MRFHPTSARQSTKSSLHMTPMIDIVFQLLVFFIMTFKIVSQEGDFNVHMPAASSGVPQFGLQIEPIRIRMQADPSGKLTVISLNDRTLPFASSSDRRAQLQPLQDEIVAMLGNERGPGSLQEQAEVELDCDFGLNYVHVVDAITAVSGFRGDDETVTKLVSKIKFAPPRPATSR